MSITDDAKRMAEQVSRIHEQRDAANLARAAADAGGKALGALESDPTFRALSPVRQSAARDNAERTARAEVYKSHADRLREQRDAAQPSKAPALT